MYKITSVEKDKNLGIATKLQFNLRSVEKHD